MPELPEVEIIRLGLQRKIVGLAIKDVQVLTPKIFQGDPKKVEGKIVLKVWRKAKILGIDIGTSNTGPAAPVSRRLSSLHSFAAGRRRDPSFASPVLTLLIHLKMTGQLILSQKSKLKSKKKERFVGGHPTEDMHGQLPNKSTRAIFTFSDNSKLYFNDQRKFGWIKVVNRESLIVNRLLESLGPEPLEKGFTWQILKQNLIKHKNLPVKVALMDQKVVAGIGNIYANEACFAAKIDPRIKISQLTDQQFRGLHRGVLKSLRDAIKHGGSSRAHFVDSEGKKGYFLEYAYVYGRDGQKCKVCGNIIQKIQLGGRGTYFCPYCQK